MTQLPPALTFNDRYEFHDSHTSTQRRQQRTLPHRQDSDPPRQVSRSSTPSSHQALQQTLCSHGNSSPLSGASSRRLVHVEAASAGISPAPLFATVGEPDALPQPSFPPEPRRLSQVLSDDLEDGSTLPSSFTPPEPPASATVREEPRPVIRISKHTRSAILWTLEEALRHPYPFSPDLDEENADMADLIGPSTGPAASNGNDMAHSRPSAPSAPTESSPQTIRGPRIIMKERAEREARRAERAERERLEREQLARARADEEARAAEDQGRRVAERRTTAAGAGTGVGTEAPIDLATQRRQQRARAQSQAKQAKAAEPPVTPRMLSASAVPTASQLLQQTDPLRPTRVSASTQQPQGFTAQQTGAGRGHTAHAAGAQAGEGGISGSRRKNSFPHAFERWEALSAHWEGMTSFWIRKLQENTDDLERNPVSAQLSRQVGDLSAAGANLFHAVVELQRLRASSERKFQRWFYDTRSEMERLRESNGMMASALDEERASRNDAIREAIEHERVHSKTQKQLTEMKRELQISKEEARRAWEELGRREQEERDRTLSLQQGEPTIVGGVQVVPMSQGVPSRPPSIREPRQAETEPAEYVAAQADDFSQQGAVQHRQGNVNTGHGATAIGPGAGGEYHQRHGPASADQGDLDRPDSRGYGEGECVVDAGCWFWARRPREQDFVPKPCLPADARKPQGSGMRASNDAAANLETPAAPEPPSATHYPPSSSRWSQAAGAPEYSGQGYAAPGWETVQTTPRHHHPTRLSDVVEEDERSRTTTSHVSRL